MARFPGYGAQAYREKHNGESVEDLASKVNGREGTETPDPASIKTEKVLTKKQKARLNEINEQ